jgi:hypothetical protein
VDHEEVAGQLALQRLSPRGAPVVGWGWTDWPVRDARGRDMVARVVAGVAAADAARALRAAANERLRGAGLAGSVATGFVGGLGDGLHEVYEPPGVALAELEDGLRHDRGSWLGLFASAAEVLAGLHAAGVVHGALRPETVFAGEGGLAVLGPLAPLAVVEGGEGGPAGAAATVAPELRDGGTATPASDVWALATAFLSCAPPGAGTLAREAAADDPALRPDAAGLARTLLEAIAPLVADDDVQFTVMRPPAIAPGNWHDLLAFAHKTDLVITDDGHELDPVAEVRRLAARALGEDAARYRSVSAPSAQSLVRGTDLRFVPSVEGAEFNPPEAGFRWTEPVHQTAFRVRAGGAEGSVLNGAMAVYCGVVLLAEVPLRLSLDSAAAERRPEPEPVSARPFEKIFPSYSHLDADVVAEVESVSLYLRNQFLRDCRVLRAGEVWSDRLRAAIDEATVFQLFWSHNAMVSAHVRSEWEYALSLGKDDFIRPVYWEWPIPRDETRGLPPPELERLHFHSLRQQPPPSPEPTATPAAPPPPRARPGARGPWWRRAAGGGIAALVAVGLVVGLLAVTLGGGPADPPPSAFAPGEVAAFLAPRASGTCEAMSAQTAREQGALRGVTCAVGDLEATRLEFSAPAGALAFLDGLNDRLEGAGGQPIDCGTTTILLGTEHCFLTPDGFRYALYASVGSPAAGVLVGPADEPSWRTAASPTMPTP